MAEEFKIKSKTVETLRVRHVHHGHRYLFAIRERPGRRFLRVGPVFGNTKASAPALTLLGEARAFAEREARKAGLID